MWHHKKVLERDKTIDDHSSLLDCSTSEIQAKSEKKLQMSAWQDIPVPYVPKKSFSC